MAVKIGEAFTSTTLAATVVMNKDVNQVEKCSESTTPMATSQSQVALS
jgi:hypothetical protein